MLLSDAAFRRRLVFCLVLAFLLRLGNLLSLEQPISDERAYLEIASNLSKGEGFRQNGVWGYRYPAYVGTMAAFFSLFGEHREPIVVAQAIMGTAAVLLFALVVRRRLGDVAALFAAFSLAIYVPFVRLAGRMYTENLFFLLVLLVWWFLERPNKNWVGQATLGGVLCGLAVLTREAFLPVAFLYALLRVLFSPRPVEDTKTMAVFLALAVLTVAPWTIRNYLLFERFVPVTTNTWFNLYMGNSEVANGRYPGPEVGRRMWSWPRGEPRRSEFLEIDLMDRYQQEVLRFWRERLGETFRLLGIKAVLLVTPPHLLDVTLTGTAAKLAAIIWSVMWAMAWLLALYGFVRGPTPLREGLWPYTLAAMTILSCLVTYVIARYRFPLELAVLYFAANGYIAALTPKRRAASPTETAAAGA